MPKALTNSSHLTVHCSQESTHPNLPSQGKEKHAPQAVTTIKPLNRSTSQPRKRAAFTLAEVLITLAIIGVVAALTIPTLISKYQDKAFETGYKKCKTVIANGYKLMMTKNDVYSINNLPLWKCEDGGCFRKYHSEAFKINKDWAWDEELTMDLPTEYSIKDSSELSVFNWTNGYSTSDNHYESAYIFQLQDGVIYGLQTTDWPSEEIYISVDLNGKTGPNTIGRDMYLFAVSGNGRIDDVTPILTYVEDFGECSIDNPSGCRTKAECEALEDVGATWSDYDHKCFVYE